MYELVGKARSTWRSRHYSGCGSEDTHYVQTEEEMKTQLLELGLRDASFDPRDGRQIEGKEMEQLCRVLAGAGRAIDSRSSDEA